MTVQLHVDLRTPRLELDAQTALYDLRDVLLMLGSIEAAEHHGQVASTRWRFRSLEVGSLTSVLEPEPDVDPGPASRAALHLVTGFALAQTQDGPATLPDAWSTGDAKRGANVTSHLRPDDTTGLGLRVVVDGDTTASADVTHRASVNLRTATRVARHSIGSVVGSLDSATVHRSFRAGLWQDRGGGRVPVHIREQDWDLVRPLIGDRVQVVGRLARNSRGQVVKVELRRIEPLVRLEDAPPLATYIGVTSGLTGELSASDHVRALRGGA